MRKTFATAFKLAALSAIALATADANALPLVWRADWPGSKPVETLVHRGTDIEFQPQWYINGELANSTNWTFQTFVQTNAQATGEWFGPLPGAAFSHTNDVGAAFYNVMVRAQMPGGGINYTAFARLRMLDSPGYTPGELPLPVSSIDFAKVVAVNAPWLLPDATNGLVEAANDYTDAKVSSIPAPDYSPGNTQLVATIEAVAPTPGNYPAVSNAAMRAVQPGELAAATNALLGVLQEEITPLQIQAWYPDGSVTSVAQWTQGLEYEFDDANHTATVAPFSTDHVIAKDNADKSGAIVVPPYVERNGMRYEVVAIGGYTPSDSPLGADITSIVAPTTVKSVGDCAFFENYILVSAYLPSVTSIGKFSFIGCHALVSVSSPSATSIEEEAFTSCTSLPSISLPAATSIEYGAFRYCTSLASASLSAATSIGDHAFNNCSSLASVDFGSTLSDVPTLDIDTFSNVPTTCKIIVPDSLYDVWIAARVWSDLYNDGNGYKFLKHSEWEYARRFELDAKIGVAANASTNYTDEALSSISASSVGAYPAASGEQLATQVAAIGANLNGEDARFVSTNYDSAVTLPAASVELKMRDEATGSNTWITIWQEMRRWTAFVGDAFDWRTWGGFYAWATNVMTELSYKADRAWGAYDSETGGYSPEGFTQVSSSNILIASGMAYQRTVTSAGSVWVLQCNQGVAQIGGDTNGFFFVRDGDGNVQFEIIKGDRQEKGCDASGITVGSGTPPVVTIPYSIVADEHPTLRICDDLATQNWKDETDPDCIANVSWSGSSGDYVATVQKKAAGNGSMYVKATYMAGGETYIRNAAPVGMDSIILNGVKYYLGTATIDGKTVLTLSTTAP